MRFLNALKNAKERNRTVVIPDIKCFSPKEGDLMRGRNPVEYAVTLCNAGAPVLSVVTEEKEFNGSLKLLRMIADAVEVPILRKDFIHTKEDLIETKEAGASAILLMCSCLTEEELIFLYKEALALGLDPFVETHEAEDFRLVNLLGAKLVGINNRNILELERDDGDVSRTVGLSALAPKDAFLVTESSIKNADEVRLAIASGADAALVGTAILQAEETGAFYRMLTRKRSLKVCGLMNEEDIQTCLSLGTDRLGLVTEYPVPVPWNLSVNTAKRLRKKIPSGYQAVMVCGGDAETILRLAEEVQPDLCQIHYRMETTELEFLTGKLHERGIRVIALNPDNDELLNAYEEIGVDEILVDPRNQDNAAAASVEADLSIVKDVMGKTRIPVILAGGITPERIREWVTKTDVRYVDVMSGSETKPGCKDREKIASLLEGLEQCK